MLHKAYDEVTRIDAKIYSKSIMATIGRHWQHFLKRIFLNALAEKYFISNLL